MTCVKCSQPAEINMKHLGGSLCRACFAEVIEKRVRKSLRWHDWPKQAGRMLYIDDGTLKSKTGLFLLKAIFKGGRPQIDFKKGELRSAGKLSKGYERIIIPWSLDDEVEQFLDALLNNKKIPATKHIKLLISVSDEEIDLFAEIKKLKGKKIPKSTLGKMLDDLEKRYPGSKFGLLRSSLP